MTWKFNLAAFKYKINYLFFKVQLCFLLKEVKV